MSETEKSEDETPRTFEFDDVFQHVPSLGRYQGILFVCISLLVYVITNQFNALVFAFGTPGFHCITPNVTCASQKCCDGCTSYVFDGPFQSTVSEWDLICDRAFLGATIQSCFFAGMLIGSFVTGIISDAWGRKKCIFVSSAFMLVAGVASAFVHNIPFFAILRFIVGFGLTGAMLSYTIYTMELVGPKQRTAVANVVSLFFNGFQMVFILIAYFIREWRTLLLVITIPAVLLFPFWKLIPQSPRWLIAHGHLEEAQSVLESFSGKKDKPVDSLMLRSLIENVRRNQLERERQAKKYTPIDLFRTPKLRKWTVILCFQWFVVQLLSFGMYLFISQLVGDIYINYLIMAVTITLRIPVTWILLLKFGRRIFHGIMMILLGIIFLLVLVVYQESPLATTALSLVGYLLIDFTWTSVYLITSESFPTVLRNTAQGTGSTSARIGGILAPYVVLMGQLPGLSIAFPVVIFALLAMLAGILMYWIPETLFAPMHQTIEETEAAEDDYGIPCCGRKRRNRDDDEEKDEVRMEDPSI